MSATTPNSYSRNDFLDNRQWIPTGEPLLASLPAPPTHSKHLLWQAIGTQRLLLP